MSSYVLAHPQEDSNFQQKHNGEDFFVGWSDFQADDNEVRIIYPAVAEGEDAYMASNGPFPFTVFFGDVDEDKSDYMILAGEIVSRGNIVIVTEGIDESDATNVEDSLDLLESVVFLVNKSNSTADVVLGSFSNIDMKHWGVSGHGTGAAVAFSVFPFWQETSLSDSIHPPRSIFGLGTDFSNWNSGNGWESVKPMEWQISPASPATGLFLTGTVDEIAKGEDNLPIIQATDSFAWQWMEVLGADHYQFQDEIDDWIFGDDRNDGDATMSQSEQINYAMSHLIPYLDLTLRGVHDDFRTSFNREVSPNTASDDTSYIYEDFFEAELLLIKNQTKVPLDINEFGRYDVFSLYGNWTLRNGDGPQDINPNWQIDIECGFNQEIKTNGTYHPNGTAQCEFDVEELAPGQHTAFMTVKVEGAPSTIEHIFLRTDSPLSLIVPEPTIQVPERGVGSITASEIAVDPDGQEVFIVDAVLSGGQINNYSVQVDSDFRSLSVTHTVTDEYVIGAEVDVLLRADGDGVIDEISTTLDIVLIPYDDPVVKTGIVATQTLFEDGPPVQVNISDYAYDPEGKPLLASINDLTSGQAGAIDFSYNLGILTLTPIPNANGATVLHVRVTDGTTEPVDLDIPVQVNPVDDPMIVNSSMWNLSMNEDETLVVNLSDFAYDIDEDILTWSIASENNIVNSVINGEQLLISPQEHFYGQITGEWLNLTDGNNNYSQSLIINVEPVPDLPILNLMNVNVIDDTAATLTWSLSDVDGVGELSLELSLDGVLQTGLSPSCIIDDSGNLEECVTMLEVPAIRNETVEIMVVVSDAEFLSQVVSYAEINFNASTPVTDDETESSEGFEVSNTLIIAGGLGLVIMILLMLIVLRTMNRNPPINETVINLSEQELEVDVLEDELGAEVVSSGLLAKIKQNQ